MVDFEKIGKRIFEERKYLHRISQEKMAEDLGMYQADISNLEKAKNGSGISDLTKLDLIADYFGIPLETLIFGGKHNQIEKYSADKMQIKENTKKLPQKHEALLSGLMGVPLNEAESKLESVKKYVCGPYSIYVATEYQILFSADGENGSGFPYIAKEHIWLVCDDEAIGCLNSYITTVGQHISEQIFENLKLLITPDIFDLDECFSSLNPYVILNKSLSTDEFAQRMEDRMRELYDSDESRRILYIESAYVREDYRQNGLLRLMMNVTRQNNPNAIMWLSLEPTTGDELNSEYGYHATYTSSELGQISLNASIAERLGFTIDSATTRCHVKNLQEDGSVNTDMASVRRSAFFFPKKIRNIVNGEEQILTLARAIGRMVCTPEEKPAYIDVYQSAWKKLGFVISIQLDYEDETVYAFARGMDWKSRWLGVSKDNPGPEGEFVETIEKYDRLIDAIGSKYYVGLMVAEQLLGATYFGTVAPENVQLDMLRDVL